MELLRAAHRTADERVLVGIGDDAAVVDAGGGPVVWTIDEAVEGTHFRRGLLSPRQLGLKATMAAASDLAAMGARPTAMLAALVLTDRDEAALSQLAEGQRRACEALGAAVVGGNLARGDRLTVTTTWIGAPQRTIPRSGAEAGDQIWLAGPVGMAAAGLAWLEREESDSDTWREPASDARPRSSHVDAAVRAWQSPVARIEDGLAASSVATAMIDVSDGLAQDVGHLALASHVRVVLHADALTSEPLDAVARELSRDALSLALSGGEDYALVASAPRGEPLVGWTCLGHCEKADPAAEVVLEHADGRRETITAAGFDHFRAR